MIILIENKTSLILPVNNDNDFLTLTINIARFSIFTPDSNLINAKNQLIWIGFESSQSYG